ncbi:MAG: response regulator, partial [Rhodospirillaceae bacterium]|nr:response regulator [Rhodospirillaceae bacterium]
GADAFKELRHFPADVIICDWSMQPLDGLDFVRMVRTGTDSPNPFVPIIMLTGHTEMHRVMEARDSGVHEFLAKPISAKGIYSRIRTIIENPRPFIRAGIYFGPDRRRKENPNYNGPERRKADKGEVEGSVGSISDKLKDDTNKDKGSNKGSDGDDGGDAETPELSQDEINALLNG